jgi:hypothetical protein
MLYGTYIKAGLLVVFVCGVFFAGWHTRDRDFTIYKDQVRIAAEKQQAENESIQKQQVLINKGIQDEYDAKLALLRQYYANGVRNNYNQLASDCAATTLQTVTLQQWITEQMAIK